MQYILHHHSIERSPTQLQTWPIPCPGRVCHPSCVPLLNPELGPP